MKAFVLSRPNLILILAILMDENMMKNFQAKSAQAKSATKSILTILLFVFSTGPHAFASEGVELVENTTHSLICNEHEITVNTYKNKNYELLSIFLNETKLKIGAKEKINEALKLVGRLDGILGECREGRQILGVALDGIAALSIQGRSRNRNIEAVQLPIILYESEAVLLEVICYPEPGRKTKGQPPAVCD